MFDEFANTKIDTENVNIQIFQDDEQNEDERTEIKSCKICQGGKT